MFKLESYITPILLSYVNRYISNLKPEDSQVSLWGGDATFHNLELNLQVLEQELQLPFSFVSGSIRELCIHVPWTKLTSEPITITINTIECILNLKGKNPTSDASAQAKINKTKKPVGKDVEAPQGYVQLLINKIVSNIRIHCNNLILKYVEEDIVLSMNVKHLKYQSANKKWEAAYTDLSPTEGTLRKIITVNDLTLCLDKRNASGKIEVYQEPMLYRCSMTMHLLKHYHSTSAKRASKTRLDIYCNNMEFSMTEQQVPMLLRLLMLLYALQQKKLKPEKQTDGQGTSDSSGAIDDSEIKESWTGWAWSYVSAVLPAPWEEEDNTEDLEHPGGHTLHLCIYVDTASVTFKVSESSGVERGTLYPQKKMRYNPMLVLKLQGLYTETVIHGMKWFNAMGGIGQAVLLPVGPCSCGEVEITDEKHPSNYLEIGSPTSVHKKDSLFDGNAEENKGNKRKYNRSWDYHMTVFTEAVLLERTPAFAFDYLYQLEVPSDTSSDILSDFGSDYEFSNFTERCATRVCLGPLRLRVCSGLLHRGAALRVAASHYDYPPYYATPTATDTLTCDLRPPAPEEVDALRQFVPQRNVRITLFAPILELELMDHPFFQPVKGCLLTRKKKVSMTNMPSASSSGGKVNLPKVTIECQFLDVTITYPMYANRVVHATCQLPDAPKKLFEACFTRKTVKVVGLCSRLLIGRKHTTILTPSSLSYCCNAILLPHYWMNPNIPHNEITFESESVTLNATNAKMMVIVTIISKLIMMDCDGATKIINTTTMLLDACKDYGFPYMELYIEGIRYKRVVTNATTSMDMSLGSIKAFIFEKVDASSTVKSKKSIASEDIQQVLFLSGPEAKSGESAATATASRTKLKNKRGTEETPLLTVTFQYPLSPENQRHAPILLFNLQEIRICVDPLLCKWLLYHPRQIVKAGKSDFQLMKKISKPPPLTTNATSASEVSGGALDTPRRLVGVSSQSVHSSLDREPIRGAGGGGPPPPSSTSSAHGRKEEPAPHVDLQEKVYNVLRKWFEVWKSVYLCGDVSQCTVYFPLVSLSAVGSQGIQEAVELAVNKEQPPELMVITLPFATVRSSHRHQQQQQQQSEMKKYLRTLPVTVPDHVWTPKSSSLPWTVHVADLSCYTVQHGNKLTFLKPVSLSATIGLSTKPPKVDGVSGGGGGAGGSGGGASSSRGGKSKGSDIGYLGICVHIDMTPILVSTSEVQVYLFASILYGLMEVATNLMPKRRDRVGGGAAMSGPPPKMADVIPSQVAANNGKSGSSAASPSTAHKDHTFLDSNSDKSSSVSAAKKKPDATAATTPDSDHIKLTAWVQWTITRFTIELLSNECQSLAENDDLESQQPRLKLVVDAEDIVSSLDLQSVYLKIKSKIGSASIQHFKRSGSKWKPGPFSGTVMRLREDVPSSSSGEQQQQERHDDQGGGGVGGNGGGGGGFICVTITRASCQHTHTLWGAGVGAAQHAPKRADKKAATAPPDVTAAAAAMLPPSKYITEIVVNVQPIDFVISLRTLRSFYLVLAPLLEIPLSSSSSSSEPVPLTSAAQASPSAVLLQTVNSQALPLAYLDCRHIRLVMPSVELGATGTGAGAQHDVIIFQVEKISLAPSAVNPICRTPIRQDIYDQAVHARILNIPGSEVEDRQYQLDVCGMGIATGTWQDMDAVFSPSGSVASPLHSLSENPAVEWNNLDSRGAHPCFQRPPSSIMNLWNVTERFDISVVAAPAILYRSHVIVCGHSLEINFVSDIVVNLSLNQIKLVSAILSEFVSLVEPLLLDDSAIARPKIIFPYSRFEPSLDEIDEWEAAVGAGAAMVGVADSGIDTSDIRSVPSSSKTALTASDHQLSYARRHSSTLTMVYTAAPVDVLFTAGKIGLSLYQIDDDGDYVGEEARPPPSLYKQHRKKKRPSSYRVDHDLDLDDDKGYDAEEESAEDGPPKMYKPLVFVMVKQPNVFVSKQAAGRRMQVSWYDVNVKLRGPEYLPVGNVPTEDDYPIGLLETRCGQPHPNTGILPAFFTLKYVKPANNKQGGAHLDVEIAKPTKLLCSMSTWSYLLIIRDRLVDTFKRTDKSIAAAKKRENDDVSGISHAKRKAGMNSKFQELKETLRSVNSANLRCGQIVFEFKSDAGHEVNLALEKITANLTLFNRPEKVSVVCGLHSVTLNVVSDRFRKILLNPWTVTCDVAMFWESWQTAESNPQIQVSVESECIMLDVSPEQIRCVQSVLKDVAEFASSFRAPEEEEDRANGRRSGSSRPVSPPLPAKKGNVAAAVAADKEQHYKDDLRAGAFQFVDANTDNVQELPMPYQVAFWNKASLCAMAWRYPQPRALTKVRVFPVPYKTGSGSSSQEDLLVLCHLEYWSECRSCYLPYTHFYLSESEVCHLTLPEATPKTVVASTWRVVITTTTATGATETDGEQKQSEQQRRQQRRRPSTNSETAHAHAQALISPRALAACMRVDSYFDRSLVPNVTAALYLTKIELALYTHFDKQMPIKLPDCLKTYTPDFLFPDTQRFLSVVLENLTAYSVCWDRDVLTVEVSAALKCNVLDYMYLTEQSLVDPFTFKMDVSLAADALNCNLICKPIQIKVGPTVGHTLAVSSQLWSQSCRQQQQHQQQEQENEGGRRELVVMTRYVVCNDTNVAVRFGQTGTDEAILLPSRCFHLYAWRSQRNKEHLKLALDDHGWTRSFSVARDAVHTVTVDSDNSLTVIVTVKSLSATQKQVIFSGQLIVSNTLLEHFDLKVVEEVPKDSKESEFKNSPTYVVAGKSNTCSIFVNNRKNYFLRLRFYGLDSAWTGDIPLREHATGSQPWLVKVPLQERGQFLSIWCRVIVQEVNRAKRTLAVLWPLFSVKSNLPISSNVHIETPTLNVHLDSLVKGRGELQQLYCPGTIDHSHQLTFRIDNSDPIASPYVPLNYSLVDHQQFFKKPELEEGATIEDILKELSGGGESTASWPYFGDELDDVDWIVGEQPLTHVQVKYQASCRYSCSLLVELVPWCLTVNTLGVPITINVGAGAAATDAVQLCKIPHYGIVAPPKLEENFNIGVCSGGTWCYTEPLQLAKSDWSQSFYMPKFTGTIPLEGCVRSAIVCDGHVCMLSLASTINNDIRLLKVSSTHVLSNHMAMQVQVICLAVPDEEGKFDIPVNMDRYCFTVAPHLDKSKCGISVIRWHTLTNSGRKSTSRAAGGAGGGGGTNYALYMSFSLGGDHWSCPIRVDKPLLRKSFAVRTGEGCSVPVVLTSQDCKGGSGGPIYLTLHEDDAPQLFIENTTGAALYVAQATGVGAGGNDVKVAEECEHFRWRCRVGNMERAYYTTPGVSDKFPDLPPAPAAAASSGASGAGGSTAAAASWAASSTAAAASDGFGDRIAIASEPDGPPTDQLRWSNALTLRHDNDQFLRIPYYGDIRVRVANTACTTIVLLESVSQVEISARDIRVRLLMQEITNGSAAAAATTATAAKKINGTSSEPGAGAGAGRKRAARMEREDCAGVGRCQSDTSMIADTGRQTTASSPPPLLSDDRRSSSHTTTRGWSETDVSALSGSAKEMIERPLLVRDGCTSLTFNAFVKSLVLVFVSDVQFDDKEKWELMSLVCDDLVCRAVQVESLKLKITTSDVQLDNQLYARESYDFPVVVVGQVSQEKRHPHRLTTLNVPIDSLIEDCDQNALLVLEFTLETWCDKYRNTRVTAVRSVKIIVNPLSCYIEDIYVTRLMEYFNTLTPNVLVMLPKQKSEVKFNVPAGSVCVPEVVSLQCAMLAKPLTVRNVLIAPISLLLSVHSSIKLYIALDQSPLQFGRFERKRLLTTPYRLGHALTMHYLSGAIFGAGWVVSSLELLGSPGGLARAMGTGLRDFVSLPCRGIFVGPMAFLRGITQGSASLMRHITAGTLQSVTKLASSVARNLDRLTLDEEHLKRTEEQRRQRPQGLAQGFMQGLTGLGISLLGAVGGIAHHPLQSMIADGASPRSLAAGVGLGLVGIVTKPLSGAAELVALTGQGLLQGAGWSSLPEPRSYPQAYKVEYAPNSTLKYSWKHVQGLGVGARMLFALEATSVVDGTVHDAVALILTTDALLVVNLDRDDAVTVFALADLHVVSSSSSPGRSDDPTVLRLKLAKPPPPAPAPPPPPPTTQQQQGQPDKTEEDFPMEMDPVSRARVADYVKSTVSLLNLQDGSVDHSEISISPLSSPGLAQVASDEDATCFTYYVSPQNRNYFVYLMKLAKLQLHNYSFPVL